MPDRPSPHASAGLKPDRLIAGRYRLVEPIARGGMAEVWEAVDDVLARPVAVKVLLPHLAADEAFVARFKHEAIAAARLSHPNIVAIYDTCSDDGLEAIVMELVRSANLREILDRQGALPPRRAVAIAVQVADALGAAHRSGLVHRDVKPGNVLLQENGRVLVADFGIAKAVEASHDLTEVGQVVGTAKYLSPEQVQGHGLDPRSDVYALGVVLYEMLCGRPPFAGDNATSTALARLTTEPLRPRQVRPGIPRAIEDVVLRAMARDPDDRYQTAGDLRAALESVDLSRIDDDVDGTVVVTPAGPDHTPVPGDAPGFGETERSWIVPATLIVVIAATLAVVGALLGRTEVGRDIFDAVGVGGSGSRSPAADGVDAGTPVAVRAAASFDPFGDGSEHDRELSLLVDGDPGSRWSTERYDSRRFGGLKPGVGVILELDGRHRLGELRLASPTQGWAVEAYVADQAGAGLDDWGEPVAAASDVRGDAALDLDGAEGAAVLVWLTDLGTGPQAGVAEIGEVALLAG